MKIRLDQLLVERGIAKSSTHAQQLILAGEIFLEATSRQPIKAGSLVPVDSKIKLKLLPAYVSRGGDKLLSALTHWKISVLDRTVLDIGSSTGGFIDCLLQNGALLVYSVDVGYGQIHPKLRENPRVRLYEETHILKWTPPWTLNSLEVKPNLVTMDLSFISLKRILPKIKDFFSNSAVDFIILIKPQFEVEKKWLVKGIVKEKREIQKTIEDIISCALNLGYSFQGHFPCPIRGTKGNQEEWLRLSLV